MPHRPLSSSMLSLIILRDHLESPFHVLEINQRLLKQSKFLDYLGENWIQAETSELTNGATSKPKLYIGGGFKTSTKTMLLSQGTVTPIPELESTQEEADTRIVLQAMYAASVDGCDKLIVHANDTDVIVILLYHSTVLKQAGFNEIWIRTSFQNYISIHQLAEGLGEELCKALPFIHSLSGRDTTSYTFFQGKKKWFNQATKVNVSSLAGYAECPTDWTITDEVAMQARNLLMAVYGRATHGNAISALRQLRAHKFLHNNTPVLKMLPPTEAAFTQHLKRAALATLIDKRATVAKPVLPPLEQFGWDCTGAQFKPVPSTGPMWPAEMLRALTCNCKKGCSKNCPCEKRNVACFIGCLCTGSRDACFRAQATIETDSESEVEGD